MTTPRQRFLQHLRERGEKPTPTADDVADPPVRLGWRGRVAVLAGFVLPILLLGGFLVSQLPWSQWTQNWNSATAFNVQTHAPGPTVTSTIAVNDPTLTPGNLDWDVLPAVLLANGPTAASPPETFNEGHVSTATQTTGRPTPLKHGGFRVNIDAGGSLPRPAVVGDTVFVSGGFAGFEVHAVDLHTGQPKWSKTLSDNGPSAVAAADGVCVVNTESCSVFAVDAETGSPKWSWYLGDPQVAAPAVAGGRVFTSYPAGGGNVVKLLDANSQPTGQTMAMTHVLACFDLHTGRLIWQNWIDGDVITQPVPAPDGRVFVATLGGTLMAFDMIDGTPKLARRNRVTTAPTVTGNDLVFARRVDDAGQPVREALVRAQPLDGVETLRFIERDAPQLDAAVQAASAWGSTGRHLDMANGLGQGAAGNGASLVGAGTVSTLQAYHGARPTLDDGRVIATLGDAVFAFDLASGDQLWRHDLPGDLAKAGGSLATPPILTANTPDPAQENSGAGAVVVGQLDGTLRILDARTGQTRYHWPTDMPLRVPPVVHDGKLIAAGQNGELRVMSLQREDWIDVEPVPVAGG